MAKIKQIKPSDRKKLYPYMDEKEVRLIKLFNNVFVLFFLSRILFTYKYINIYVFIYSATKLGSDMVLSR